MKGHFEEYQGRLDLSADPAIVLTVDAASIQTGNRKRDQHLRSADFFDVENTRKCSSSPIWSSFGVTRSECVVACPPAAVQSPVEPHAQVRRVNGEPAIEASTSAPHRELGMTWNRVRMIRSHSKLVVKSCLIRTPDSAA